MSLNLHLLRIFFTVVRTGSFSRAAELLNVSQPAISRSVRDFELQVGCRLLDRSPKGVTPTSEGLALSQHAEVLFAVERAAEEELVTLRGRQNGSLRVGASTTIAKYTIARYLGAFHRANPKIDLHLVSANTQNIVEQMSRQDIDIALVEGRIDDKLLIARPWRTDTMKLVVAPNHLLARAAAPIDPKFLENEVLIVREPGSGSREVVTQALSDHGVEPARTLEIDSIEAIKQMVAIGVGVSILSTVSVRDQVQLGHLKVVEMHGVSIERTFWQLKFPGHPTSPAARIFERMLYGHSDHQAKTEKSALARQSSLGDVQV